MAEPAELTSATLCDKGLKHLAQGDLAEAERNLRAALSLDPSCARAVAGMGDLALQRGQAAAAFEFHDIAVGLDPQLISSGISLNVALLQQGRHDIAILNLRAITAKHPENALAHYWLGHALLQAGRSGEALDSLERGFDLWPDLIAEISFSIYGRLQVCDWAGWSQTRDFVEQAALAGRGVIDPMTMMALSDSPAAIQACARTYGTRGYPPAGPVCPSPHPPGERIRLAYLGADFHDHPVAHLFAGVLEAHHRQRFELTAFSYGPDRSDPVRARLRAGFDHFVDCRDWPVEDIVSDIVARKIDIAISMNGYTTDARPRILSFRPAPVQVNFQGYPGTLGVEYADYLIADRHVIPPGDEKFYDESIVRLPHTYQPTDNRADIAAKAPARAAEGLPDGKFVYMGYNAAHKVAPALFDRWMSILGQVPDSVLWIQGRNEQVVANLSREAAARGIDPARLVFARRVASRAEHLARHRLADLFLDTLPYNAHATASDALWAGLPVLTCRGNAFAGRVCAGLVESAGLPELVTETPDAYEALAVALGRDRPRLAALRAKAEATIPASPLFNTEGYTRALETAYEWMFQRSQAGLAPEAFDVDALY